MGSITGSSAVTAKNDGTLTADSIGEEGSNVDSVSASGGNVTSTGDVYADSVTAESETVAGASVNATDAVVADGDPLKATSGDVNVGSVTGTGSVEAAGQVTADQGITAGNGITATSGSIVASSGDIQHQDPLRQIPAASNPQVSAQTAQSQQPMATLMQEPVPLRYRVTMQPFRPKDL